MRGKKEKKGIDIRSVENEIKDARRYQRKVTDGKWNKNEKERQ